jgi:hypothetical protein
MLFNNAVSVSVGLVPIAGDVILAIYKANSRNAALLEEYLRIRGEEFIKRENKGEDSKKGGSKKVDGKGTMIYFVSNTASREFYAFFNPLADKPMSKSDLEQIKPGAGKDTKSVDVKEGTIPGGLPEAPPKKMSSVLRWRPSSRGKANDDSKEKLSTSPIAKGTQGERSKFVEDVSSSEPLDQGNSGTLKKKSMK